MLISDGLRLELQSDYEIQKIINLTEKHWKSTSSNSVELTCVCVCVCVCYCGRCVPF